ncbi:MAG: glucokinase, partial [Nitrospinaceae bacterium]|nr:glucokinase [Nitrospinaceae bacterium]NIR56883.1 glucokinase [Nitrospinaceae bacterium]NIS87345.1 glucokinase [Nitrospinaceae bacterium]NIT84200.1 glucokinase [Nitrospinaceae bacterium]NIU46385.1 glucokinase [Nitrospinaceae bacterium]
MILAGDIGGTKVNLALFEDRQGRLHRVEETKFESRSYEGLEDILDEFLRQTGKPVDQAGFGVAGPVQDGRCEVTNLPWVVETDHLRRRLNLDSVWLINDLAAMACAIPFLQPAEIEVLQDGVPEAQGRFTILAAGTGLGEAFLVPAEGGKFLVLDTEGGHCDFAPRDREETELLLYLTEKFGRVSLERILSGPGLHHLYQFVSRYHSLSAPDWLVQELAATDPGIVVTRNGLNRKSPACVKALEMFVSIYGAVAGNLALQLLTRGGVYVGGGIAPKILP